MKAAYYVYLLLSLKDKKCYTGFTSDLKRRIKEHHWAIESSTRHRGPFQLIYYEFCLNKKDAIVRERYLKSGKGKAYLKSRLKCWLKESVRGMSAKGTCPEPKYFNG